MPLAADARRALEDAVAASDIPGGVVAACTAHGEVELACAGVSAYGGASVATSTRYDLASLSKVVATLPTILRLVSDGELRLDDRLGRFFSNAGWFQQPSVAAASVADLLAHRAGLSSWEPFFARVSTRQTMLAAVLQAPVAADGAARYSDIGFMLLGAIVERVTGERLDRVAQRLVFEPLGMTRTGFGPIPSDDVAATEDCGWRGRLLVGEVHDENASVWDGVAGHAGLFSDAGDIATYAAAWLRADATLGDPELLAAAVSEQARAEDGSRRGLGWLLAHPGVFAGDDAPGFGHTGFTGTSLWIDRDAGRASVLLTNRVHPSRQHGAGIAALRRTVHGAHHAKRRTGAST